MESGWNVCVWLVGVVSGSEWNLWVWLAGAWMWVESMGVASGCGCREVYRFPHITYPYSSCICSFCSSIPINNYSATPSYLLQQHNNYIAEYNLYFQCIIFLAIAKTFTFSSVSPLQSLFDVGSDVAVAGVVELSYISRKNEARVQGKKYIALVNHTSVSINSLTSIFDVVSDMAVCGSVAEVVNVSVSSTL